MTNMTEQKTAHHLVAIYGVSFGLPSDFAKWIAAASDDDRDQLIQDRDDYFRLVDENGDYRI